MSKKSILFLDGIPDKNIVKVRNIEKNGKVIWRGSGSANLSKYLQNDLFDRSVVVFDTHLDQKLPGRMIHAVFNQISDADSHKIALKKADDFYKQVSDHVPFFNPPSHIMKTTRDNIYRSLQRIDKLHVPKTVKIQPESPEDIYHEIKKEGFEYPVIFRQAGDHGGVSTIRIDDETEQFYSFALDGRDYYLTQFVEYAEEDGLYKKYRLIVVDGKVYLRHVKVSPEWLVHHKNQIENPEKLQERSAQLFKKNKQIIQKVVTKIFNQLQLDYFGIDCYIDNNLNLLVFEVNVNMGVFLQAKGDIFKENVEQIRKALINMIDNRMTK